MAITTINNGLTQEKGINYTVITDSSVDWTGVTNSTYLYDKATDLPYYKSSGGTVVSLFEEGGGTFVTGGTYSGSTIILNRNDGNSVDVTGITSDSIYTADDTIGAGRVATLTDSLNFSEGTFNLFGLNKDKKVSYVGGNSVFTGPSTYVVNALNFKYDSNTGTGQLWTINSSEGNGKINIKGSETLIENIYTKHNLRVSGNSNAVNAERSIEVPFGTNGTWKGVNMLSTQKSGGGADFEMQVSPGGLGGTYETALKIAKNKDITITKKLELSTTTDGFLMPRLTTAQMNAVSSPDTYLKILNTDDNREYRYNGSAWVSNEYIEYDFALRSSGVTTYYTDFYTCYNASVAGDVIDVQTDQTVDCGNITSWTWTNDITINLNGHHVNCTNLQRLYIETGINVKMTNGTFSVESTSINTAAIMFKGGNTFVGDGAVTVYQSVGGSTRGSFTGAGARSTVSGVIMKGSHTYCAAGYITLDNCILYKPTGGPETIYGDNVRVNNSTIYGPVFGVSGNYTIPSRETVRTFNNCVIITDGESAIGARSAIFNNCSIKTNDDEVRNGIGGEQEYNNCKIERTGTSGTAFSITNASNVRMYNTQIISTGNGVLTNLPMEFYNCYIKANGGAGIINTTGAGMIIRGGTIDSTGGSALLFSTANVSGIAEVSNVTLMCNTTGKYCLEVNTNTTLTFSNLSMKNTSTSTDIYSRAGILSENLQIETTDAFGNIILK
tara:strand:+ start:373 stop:2547 length:2175 start_codon:yes stop_codon:yes gene_type:complete